MHAIKIDLQLAAEPKFWATTTNFTQVERCWIALYCYLLAAEQRDKYVIGSLEKASLVFSLLTAKTKGEGTSTLLDVLRNNKHLLALLGLEREEEKCIPDYEVESIQESVIEGFLERKIAFVEGRLEAMLDRGIFVPGKVKSEVNFSEFLYPINL